MIASTEQAYKVGIQRCFGIGMLKTFRLMSLPVLYLVLMAVLELATLLDLMQFVGSASLPAQRQGEVRSLGLCLCLWYNAELVLGTRSSRA